MKTMNRYRSNDQAKLKVVGDAICDNIESLLELFNIDYKTNPKMISMACPIHGGDNISAVNIYPDGDVYRGNWTCRTHGCEKIFRGSILGFIRGVLSHQKYGWSKNGDESCSFNEAIEFALSFTKQDLKNIKISKSAAEKKNFSSAMHYINPTPAQNNTPGIARELVRKSLSIPAEYYLNRGYSKEILDKYDVGLCSNPNKEMYNRVVVPIYNYDHTHMIGCTGRSIFEKCNTCKGCHDPNNGCPSSDTVWKYSKWKHNLDFKSQNHLYNLWFAKDYILKTSTAIIVESPGNVWRLEENGIHNSVAIFGSSMSDRQKFYLDSSGAMNLVILTDNDEAGRLAAEKIKEKCQQAYRVYIPNFSKSDVGEMTSEEIETQIKPILKGLYD
jgi:5S rRNA maturation endonuclease (ribonuclease M5)